MSMLMTKGHRVLMVFTQGDRLCTKTYDSEGIPLWELEGDLLLKFAVDVPEGTIIFYNDGNYLAPENYKAGDYVYFAKGTFHPKTFRFTVGSLDFCNYYSEIYVLKDFDFSKVTGMWTFCYIMPLLTKVDVSHLDTSKVKDMNAAFRALPSVSSLNLSNFDTSNVVTFLSIFMSDSNLTNIILGNGWGRQTSTATNALLLDFGDCGSSKSYQLTDETYKSMLTMYDRKSAGLVDMTLKFNKKHNIPDGWIDKMTALGYTITLA